MKNSRIAGSPCIIDIAYWINQNIFGDTVRCSMCPRLKLFLELNKSEMTYDELDE